jgi:hypothetical protein
VPVALSCTHVGISSLRIEGAWMAIGQGAGIAAALSAKRGVDVQELQYPLLRERLVSQGQVLELPGAPKKTTATREAAVKEARVAYSAHETRAKNVPVIISSGGRETKFTVDQTQLLPSGDRFQHIGNVELIDDSEITFQIQTVETTGFVILDAIQLIPVPVASVTR